MRTRRALALVTVLLALAWWLWPRAEAPADDPAAARREVAREAREAARPKLSVRRTARPTPPPAEPPPPDPGPTTARWCAMGTPAEGAAGTLTIQLPTGPHTVSVRVAGGGFPVDAPDGAGAGRLDLYGYAPAPVDLTGGGCVVGPLRGRAAITGVVVASEGISDDRIQVSGCGARAQVDVDGGFFLEIDARPCTLWAVRRDGVFRLRSDPLELDPQPGEDLVVTLHLPPWRAAGVGVHLAEADDGLLVRDITPDTPAAQAGLEPGDRIVALDGEDVVGLSVWEFVDIALGPEGSEVVYTVVREDETLDVSMVRALVD